MRTLEDYRRVAGDEAIHSIYKNARKLYGKHIVHINSTYQGGGVAELLSSMVPLLNPVGIKTGWRLLHGTPDFFTITKKFHNALQGGDINFTEMKKRIYINTNEVFSLYTHIDHDCVIVHDPQPLPLIRFYQKRQPWIWRCHVDLSNPNQQLWDFLKSFILRYDIVIVSSEKYMKKDLPVEHRIVQPAIDPLVPKNIIFSETNVQKFMKKFNIPTDKPLITQISRFDKWKDPEGVVEIFKRVKEEVDCRLVLCGNMATDDPEGSIIYEQVKRKAQKFIDRGEVLLITIENNILVNALQASSKVIFQKSIREGFGLTVTEAMWKGKPVIASRVGGITIQIKDGENGFLFDPHDIDGFAKRTVEILKMPEIGIEVGRKARETVRKNFLITRLINDYLQILNDMIL